MPPRFPSQHGPACSRSAPDNRNHATRRQPVPKGGTRSFHVQSFSSSSATSNAFRPCQRLRQWFVSQLPGLTRSRRICGRSGQRMHARRLRMPASSCRARQIVRDLEPRSIHSRRAHNHSASSSLRLSGGAGCGGPNRGASRGIRSKRRLRPDVVARTAALAGTSRAASTSPPPHVIHGG